MLAASAQATVGVTDVVVLFGGIRGDLVGGLGFVSSVGPVGLHGDATVTHPADDPRPAADPDPFFRVVVGADGRPTSTTTISGEVYVQTLGASDPSGYLPFARSDRFARGELRTMGHEYAALSVAQLTPLGSAGVSTIANLRDPSALIAPNLSISAADDVAVAFGGYVSVGARPDEVPLVLDPATLQVLPPSTRQLDRSANSEFGLYTATVFLSMKAWF